MSGSTGGGVLTAAEIAEILGGDVLGDPSLTIRGVAFLDHASPQDLTYVADQRNAQRIAATPARLLLAPVALRHLRETYPDRTFVLVDHPEVALLLIAGLLKPARPSQRRGISDRAAVDDTARILGNTNIGPFAVVGQDVLIGHNCDIHPGVVIGDGCRIGDHVTLHPNTVLYPDCILGNHVVIHAACVIGSDGFGYRTVNGGHVRLPHHGIVRICDDVEIGAGTTIDRAKVGETVIGTGTRIDNQVMIAHNCRVGKHNLLVSQVGFAGSVTTGDYVVCAGQAGIADHVHLGTGAVIGAKAGVHRDMPGGQAYLGIPAAPAAETTRQLTALKRLPELRDTIRQLEKDLAQLRAQMAQLPAAQPLAESKLRAA